jgi:predicted CoA-binding protein
MIPKKTLVLGASPKAYQYSHEAVKRLLQKGHPVEAIGRSPFALESVQVQTGMPPLEGIHTITLYLNKDRQKEYEDYLLSLHPQRIIFNPGAENPDLYKKAIEMGIESLEACTLVMLSTGTY